MILNMPKCTLGLCYHDNDKDTNIANKHAPKEGVALFKGFNKEYFDTYKIHFLSFIPIKPQHN